MPVSLVAIAVASGILLSLIVPIIALPNAQPSPTLLVLYPYSAGFIPIVDTEICAMPPGVIATDGCDDICNLVGCCSGWETDGIGSEELPSGEYVDCSGVNCGNVCRMACDRVTTDEPCNKVCGNLMSDGTAYVFSRPGFCEPPVVDSKSPTHVGFGFEVSSGVYLFGSVENSGGFPIVLSNFDNGFWMTTGTLEEMLATFANPSASGFYGTSGVPPYTEYRTSVVQTPRVCKAARYAENLYSVGYNVLGNNCLDAVYNVLSVYGVNFPSDITPANYWCPSGTLGWFEALPDDQWASAQTIPSGTPVTAAVCPSDVPSTCAPVTSAVPTSNGGACDGLDFTNCVPCEIAPVCVRVGFAPGEIGGIDPATCTIPCSQADPCVCGGACDTGVDCLLYNL